MEAFYFFAVFFGGFEGEGGQNLFDEGAVVGFGEDGFEGLNNDLLFFEVDVESYLEKFFQFGDIFVVVIDLLELFAAVEACGVIDFSFEEGFFELFDANEGFGDVNLGGGRLVGELPFFFGDFIVGVYIL